MARDYYNLNKDNESTVKSFLETLIDENTSTDRYREAFHSLGRFLGQLLCQEYDLSEKNTHLVCATEDADWLAKGVLEGAGIEKAEISVYWTSRKLITQEPRIEISPIYKEYNSSLNQRDHLIVVKSIISSSCVVKTHITHIVNNVKPKIIHILSPVMLQSADDSLKKEFPPSIFNKFHFLTFAKDTESDENGVVIPGIGGMVYDLLGIDSKESYLPDLVMKRMWPSYFGDDLLFG